MPLCYWQFYHRKNADAASAFKEHRMIYSNELDLLAHEIKSRIGAGVLGIRSGNQRFSKTFL